MVCVVDETVCIFLFIGFTALFTNTIVTGSRSDIQPGYSATIFTIWKIIIGKGVTETK